HIPPAAARRLRAIEEFSELGAGFAVAMRDLEIRGAGNLLGTEQSGHINIIGFELYCQLLRESIARLKGTPLPRPPQVALKLDFLRKIALEEGPGTLAHIPGDYIPDLRLRIEAYRKIAQVATWSEVESLRAELRDRYGRLPRGVRILLALAELKLAASEAGVDTIETRGEKLILTSRGQYYQVKGRFPRLRQSRPEGKLREIREFLKRLHEQAASDGAARH
ncbi:MAG: transcription-repair coupling factor, partial [Verrucomicrobiae bacterium]|nr:transcription-repair coupling factor [Verrucomicrobiae bacterium]